MGSDPINTGTKVSADVVGGYKMQIIEKEIGRADSLYFGELVCLADSEGNPCFWAIRKKID